MNNVQLIILLLFGGLSVLSWVIGKLREQSAIKQQRDAARKRYEEELRTGRPTASAPARPTSAAEDLAARRQAQLAELRRQQESRARQQQPGAGRDVVIVRAPSPGQTAPAPFPGMPRAPGAPGRRVPVPTTPAPIPVPARRPTGAGRAVARRPSDAEAAVARAEMERLRREEEERARRAARQAASEAERRRQEEERRQRTATGVPALTRSMFMGADGRVRPARELRALIAATEVLGPPVAMRTGDRLV